MYAVMRDLKSEQIYFIKNIKLSRFRPPGLREVIKGVPDDHFIIGVVYDDNDSQICISGKVKKSEKLHEGCIREMREEVFMKPCEGKTIPDPILKEGPNYFYRYNISDLEFSPIKVNDIEGEDTRNRIVACIHGSPKDVKAYLKGIKKQDYINDSIEGIWASDKKSILKAVAI